MFEQDQVVTRYRDFDQLIAIIAVYSADLVGRLVLGLCGYRDEHRRQLSDATCTALQLANFWQDVTRRSRKGSRLSPSVIDTSKHGYSVEELFARKFDASRSRPAMRDSVRRGPGTLFFKGLPLAAQSGPPPGDRSDLFSRGGLKILEKIGQQNYDVLRARPSISKVERAGLLLSAVTRRVFSRAA